MTVLSDPEFEWIEIDSVTYSLVDDIVVGKTDGTLICCQCKKNQIDFKEWSIANLDDELGKAFSLLADDKNVEVRFYSRSSFGALAKLREYCTTQAHQFDYYANLGKKHKKTDIDLAKLHSRQTQDLSTYDFLH